LHPAAPVEGFGQVLERKVVNSSNYGTRRKGRGSVLDVQDIDRMAAQLAGKRQRDADQRRMRQGLLDLEVRPTLIKPLNGGPFGDVQSVKIGLIDLGEGLDQVDGVTFIAAEFGPDGVRIDCDV
jgi:hypothetical protein